MTTQEIICDLRDQAEVFGPCTIYHLLNTAADELEDLNKQVRCWVSVKDRLPDNNDTMLIAHRGGVSFGWYNGRYWERGASTKHRELQTVFYWMPLPALPEEVSHEP